MNRVILVGRLGSDAEVKETKNGLMAVLSVATSEGYRDKETGEWMEITDWHRVVTFQDGLAEMLRKHGKKGRLVSIEGKNKTGKYEVEGETRYSAEVRVDMDGSIRFHDKAPDGAEEGGQRSAAKAKAK